MKRKSLILIFTLLFLLLPNITFAAILYFDPAEGAYGPGDEFKIDIKIDLQANCVNTVEAFVGFSKDSVNLVDFSSGESFLSVWVDKPATADIAAINNAGELSFSGGIPGGYCGKIPGDPGASNIVGSLIFKIPEFAAADKQLDTISLELGDNSRVFINDGLGNTDELILKEAEYKIVEQQSIPLSEWEAVLKRDNIPPEPFVIELRSDPSMFAGQYYVYFSTVDKQSGLDHYEILEIKPGQEIGVLPEATIVDKLLGKESQPPAWKTVDMPYVLEDQSLSSVIKIKAIDKARNERIVEYTQPTATVAQPAAAKKNTINILIAAFILLVLIIIIIIIIKKIRGGKNEKIKNL